MMSGLAWFEKINEIGKCRELNRKEKMWIFQKKSSFFLIILVLVLARLVGIDTRSIRLRTTRGKKRSRSSSRRSISPTNSLNWWRLFPWKTKLSKHKTGEIGTVSVSKPPPGGDMFSFLTFCFSQLNRLAPFVYIRSSSFWIFPYSWFHLAYLITGQQLRFYHPFVYHWSASPELISAVPNLAAAAMGDYVKQPPWTSSLTLYSTAQLPFTSFAKSRQFGLGNISADRLIPPDAVDNTRQFDFN